MFIPINSHFLKCLLFPSSRASVMRSTKDKYFDLISWDMQLSIKEEVTKMDKNKWLDTEIHSYFTTPKNPRN
jgi:hypothetical protein